MSHFDRAERYSHYADDGSPVELATHHKDVAIRARHFAPSDATTTDGTPVADILDVVAEVHDFGKLTTTFQRHLDGEAVDGETMHAPLGALVGYYALEAGGYSDVESLLGFVAIAKHHGRLPDVADYVFDSVSPSGGIGRTRYPIIHDQVADIDTHAPDIADDTLREATDGDGSWEDFAERIVDRDWIVDILQTVSSGVGIPTNAQADVLPDEFYDGLLPVWSTLTLADKTSAAALTARRSFDTDLYDGNRPSQSRLEAKISELQTSLDDDASDEERRLHELRAQAHDEVLQAVDEFVDSECTVGTVTLPTGLGKTLTGIHAGLELLEQEKRTDGRLVYALPFTSIIDQVAADCREIFETNGRDSVLTLDHHLETTAIQDTGLDAADPDQLAHLETMLGNSWRSGMVITTFVQLFESLAGPKNGQSTKLPGLDGSTIIIDEPQALPEAWWPLVRRLVRTITNQYDARLIVMTATQPKVLEEAADQSTFEFVDDPSRYYEELDRVEFELHDSAASFVRNDPVPLEYDAAAETLLETTEPTESVLAICNTIDSARELTERLVDRRESVSLNEVYNEVLDSFDGLTSEVDAAEVIEAVQTTRAGPHPVFVHLTTRHRPVDRKLLLSVTRDLIENGIPVTAVTTQLVEAGVDISFDRVFRDFAPMSSIVQAAGRCNRSFATNQGTVTVWLLDSPGSSSSMRLPSVAVYGGDGQESRPKLTAQALAAVQQDGTERRFSESIISWDVVTDYFDRLQARNPGAREYVEYVDDALIDQLGRQSLITTRNSVEVVIARTADERTLLDDIDDAFDQFDFNDLEELMAETQSLQVSIPVYDETSQEAKQINKLQPIHADSTRRQVKARVDQNDAYSPLTGLSVPSETIDNRFL